MRLIRSKGVGVFFITQDPSDIPEDVAGQLGNRFQHALRAATAKDDRSIKAAAETFRPNPGLDVAAAITSFAPARRWSRCSTRAARRSQSSAR